MNRKFSLCLASGKQAFRILRRALVRCIQFFRPTLLFTLSVKSPTFRVVHALPPLLSGYSFFLSFLLSVIFLGAGGVSTAYAQITITPVTWNVIGLDSNNTTVGPDLFSCWRPRCQWRSHHQSNHQLRLGQREHECQP